MTEQHPITPPPELVKQWLSEPEYGAPGRVTLHTISEKRLFQLLTRAAQWGADQELDACCEWLDGFNEDGEMLRLHRRPKPPSLKKQMLARTKAILNDPNRILLAEVRETLELNQRALKALPDD